MKVKFIQEATAGNTVLEAADKLGVKIKSPCNGKGKCGKCLVKLKKGELSEINKKEKKELSKKKIDNGYRLACQAEVIGDVEIEIK